MFSTITLSDVSFELSDGRILFKNININLNTQLTALVGPNGIGKTCLAKIIAEDLLPTSGLIKKNGEINFFSQREVPPDETVSNYLLTKYSWSLLGEFLLSGIERSTHCSDLSGGEWMRVRLAATLKEQYLILDEPTNDLDQNAKLILKNFISEYQFGVLLISHDREFLQLCDEVLELSHQGLKKFGGGWSLYEHEKDRERNQLLESLNKARRDRDKVKIERTLQIEMQEKRNRQGKKSAEKRGMPKILIGARKMNAQKTLGKIDVTTFEKSNSKVKEAHEAFEQIKVDPSMYVELEGKSIPNQKLVAEASEFNILYNNWLYKNNLNFSWKGNIRLAIKGANGSGKTSLLKALMGYRFNTKGELRLGKLATLYLDQNCSNIDDTKSIIENVRAVAKINESDIRNKLAKLLFSKNMVFQKVGTLSGGERLRVALACGLLADERPELIILDEPTNNLDLVNINFIEKLILNFKGAIIIISHDETFLNNCGIESVFLIEK